MPISFFICDIALFTASCVKCKRSSYVYILWETLITNSKENFLAVSKPVCEKKKGTYIFLYASISHFVCRVCTVYVTYNDHHCTHKLQALNFRTPELQKNTKRLYNCLAIPPPPPPIIFTALPTIYSQNPHIIGFAFLFLDCRDRRRGRRHFLSLHAMKCKCNSCIGHRLKGISHFSLFVCVM